jgi:hypothetical protein
MTSDKDTTFAFLRGARALGHSSWHCLPQQVSVARRGRLRDRPADSA